MAGAVFHPLPAQVDTGRVRRDSATIRIPIPPRADSVIRRDSTGAPRTIPPAAPDDSVQPPLTRAWAPASLGSEQHLRFDRDALFASGAITLQDLLERAMIATPISAGYLSAPAVGFVAGDSRRVRVFIDGVERESLDPRSSGALDLSQVQLWSAEEVVIETVAAEVRVHLRTWRVDRTSSYTRTDIATGDQQANLYRLFYGRRTSRGAAIQLGAQQYSTTPPSYLGASADQLGIMIRGGWAGDDFSADVFATRVGRNRGDIRAFGRVDSLRGLESTRLDAYARVGYRDPDTSAVWGQVMATTASYRFEPIGARTSAVDTTARDTSRSQVSYIGSAGLNRGPLGIAAFARVTSADSRTLIVPRATARYATGPLVVRGGYEGRTADSLSRADVTAELTTAFFRAGGAVDRVTDDAGNSDLTTLGTRAWAGIRYRDLWLDAGFIARDSVRLRPPGLFGTTEFVASGPVSGLTAAITGRVWKAVHANVTALRWNDTADFYRPQYQTRTEFFVRTSLLDRFPRGNFGFLLSARHDYRSATLFPVEGGDVLRATGDHALSTLLEIRLYAAVLSWQMRNVVGSRNYQAPDYLRPRTTNFYGVRWDFWN